MPNENKYCPFALRKMRKIIYSFLRGEYWILGGKPHIPAITIIKQFRSETKYGLRDSKMMFDIEVERFFGGP